MTAIYKMYWESIKGGTRIYSEQSLTVRAKVDEIALNELEKSAITQEEYNKYLGIEVSL